MHFCPDFAVPAGRTYCLQAGAKAETSPCVGIRPLPGHLPQLKQHIETMIVASWRSMPCSAVSNDTGLPICAPTQQLRAALSMAL